MNDFRFIVCPVLSTVPFGELELENVVFTESVDGKGTTFEASAFPSSTQSASRLKELLNYGGNPNAIALYVKSGDGWLWGGVLQQNPWDGASASFKIKATYWKSWLYARFLEPAAGLNPVQDFKYS